MDLFLCGRNGPDASLGSCVRSFIVSSSFVLHLCTFLKSFQDTLHAVQRYAKFLANISLGITSVVQKWNDLCLSKRRVLFFNGITKETGQITCYCDRLQVTKWLKIQFKTRSLLGCLSCVGTTLVYPLC